MKSLKAKIKRAVFSSRFLLSVINKIFMSNKFKIAGGNNNTCNINCILHNSEILINGLNNRVVVEGNNARNKIDIIIMGDNNSIYIGQDVLCRNVKLWMEGNNNRIEVNNGTVFAGKIQLSAIEGTKIQIGESCLFSDEIDIRTGDGHSIVNSQGERTNQSSDITIGNHVWCGRCVSILKNAEVPSDSVIATRSVVTKKYSESNIILAGCPAKIVKQNINWNYDRR